MGLFGKSEQELKQIAAELDKKQTDLDNRESGIKSKESAIAHEHQLLADAKQKFESERKKYADNVSQSADTIAAEMAELEKRRLEIAQLEAKAKSNFVAEQRNAFKDVIARQQAHLDDRKADLDALADEIAKRLQSLHAKEGELASRELSITEREQKADAGFADKAKSLAEEASRQHKANQDEADRLRHLADAIAQEHKKLEDTKAILTQREQDLLASEQKRDAGFAEERNELQKEIAETRAKKLAALEQEITGLRTTRLNEVTQAESTERERVQSEIAKDREAWAKEQDIARKRMESERTELEKQKGAVSALQSELEGRKVELDASERLLERKEQRLEQQWQKRNAELEEVLEDRIRERRQSLEIAQASFKEEVSRLRDSLRIQTDLLGAFEQLKRQLGDKDPAEILRELNRKTDELSRLQEELATRPTEEMRERYQVLESEASTQKARADELARQIAENTAAVAEVNDLRRNNSELNAENKTLAQRASRFEGAANEAQAELDRLRAAYERPAEVAARYKEIEMPHIKADKIAKPPQEAEIDEMTWLEGVGNACESYGLHFNPRILKAFHTALKTSEWSPLTVLAGVSGTGKSELPRLYSHFGGIFFEPLSVQPNWDSQESMLGFFNSIDNKFDAQPVLRFLAQSQKQWGDKSETQEGYPGLQDAVCLVLLDEMNLAHPELYFAEFLSKLELRRGMKGSDVPSLPVKIGAGMPPYQLPLGRNVLWTGTMNQDETTKSLSDKVLDRSIIIHFPRPTELKRRLKLAPLDEKNRGPILHKISWQSWLAQGSAFTEDDIKPFKSFIEEMNATLSVAGRAIGHRVWQSVEYYMANYPDVRSALQNSDKDKLTSALHIAFEDQLVQKVMPKLRGIDTRGKGKTECLDKIRGQIVAGIGGNSFDLSEDFDLACELGYGQFIWQSANYLKEEAVESIQLDSSKDDQTLNSQQPDESPPDWFAKGNPNRLNFWQKKTPKQRQELISNHEKQEQA